MRGLTITDAFVLADEVQNASTQQVGTLCTRAGERCKLVFTGDPGQVDKKKANWATSGWLSWLSRFEPKPEAPESFVDDSTGKTYYYNSELNQTSWAPPSAPMVEL